MMAALLRASLGGAVAVAVVWTISRLLPRLSPAVRTTMWWLAAAKFLISLVWISPLEIPVLPAATLKVAQSTGTGAIVAAAAGGAVQPASWNLEMLVLFVWGAGAAIALVLGMRQWRRASAIVRTSRPASAELNAMASNLAGRLGLATIPPVLESDLIDTPLVTGLRRPAVVVPVSFHSLLPDQQRMALCHELAHVKRADLSLGAVPALVERIFFFHPLVHVASREYSIWREAACDRDVLDALDAAPDEYGRLLVDLGVSRPRAGLAAAGASWSFTSLKRRLSMLTESPNRSKYSRAIAITAVGIAALTLMPLTLSARPVVVMPDAPVRQQAVDKPQAQAVPAIRAVLFSEKTRLRGERNDVVRAMAYRTGDEKLAWFQIGDSEYVLRDAALLTRLEEAWEKAIATEDPADISFVDALLKRFADGGRATKVK